MYRDDTCAVCGESLPPDHFYCREHALAVDDRLHEIGALVARLAADTARLAELLAQVADETWDYVAEGQADDPVWPPKPVVQLRADADEVAVDVDREPGLVQVRLGVALPTLLAAVADQLGDPETRRFAAACAGAEGANATH